MIEKLNRALNIADSYKDLTPSEKEKEDKKDKKKDEKIALSGNEKKVIFRNIIDQIFDINNEFNINSDTLKDKIKKQVNGDETLEKEIMDFLNNILYRFYPEGLNGSGTEKLNLINDMKISINNLIKDIYLKNQGINKYNQHLPPDDKIYMFNQGKEGINIFYDTGKLPKTLFFPEMYKIIYTPGTYIDPGSKISDVNTIIALENENIRYDLNNNILKKYGLDDVLHKFSVEIKENTVTFNLLLNTIRGLDEYGNIQFSPTIIEIGFNKKSLKQNYGYQRIIIYNPDGTKNEDLSDETGEKKFILTPSTVPNDKLKEFLNERALDYFRGNSVKNKYIKKKLNERKDEDEQTYLARLINTPSIKYKLHNEFIKYIVIKELGDTLQVAWIDKILEDNNLTPGKFNGINGIPITRENTYIESGDLNVISRCILNGYNSIHSGALNTTIYTQTIDKVPILPSRSELNIKKITLPAQKSEKKATKTKIKKSVKASAKPKTTLKQTKGIKGKPKRGGARRTTYFYEENKEYIKNPGYITYYVICNFPRIILMAYSILRYAKTFHNITSPEITNLLSYCVKFFEYNLSYDLTQIFGNPNEFNYYYNINTDEEYNSLIDKLQTYDKHIYMVLKIVYEFMTHNKLFLEENEVLYETLKMITSENDIPMIITTEESSKLYSDTSISTYAVPFFELLIDSYNHIADIDKLETMNTITSLENDIKESKMKDPMGKTIGNVIKTASKNIERSSTSHFWNRFNQKKLSPILETNETNTNNGEKSTSAAVKPVDKPASVIAVKSKPKTTPLNPLSKLVRGLRKPEVQEFIKSALEKQAANNEERRRQEFEEYYGVPLQEQSQAPLYSQQRLIKTGGSRKQLNHRKTKRKTVQKQRTRATRKRTTL